MYKNHLIENGHIILNKMSLVWVCFNFIALPRWFGILLLNSKSSQNLVIIWTMQQKVTNYFYSKYPVHWMSNRYTRITPVSNSCFYTVTSHMENNNIPSHDRKNGCHEEVDIPVLLYSLFTVGMSIISGNARTHKFYFRLRNVFELKEKINKTLKHLIFLF